MRYLDISAAVHSRAGLGRYADQLAQALIGRNPEQYALFYNRGQEGQLPPHYREISQKSVRFGYKPWRMMVLWAHLTQQGFNHLIPDATLFHSTEHLLFPLRGLPTVLTIHDLIFKLFPHYHKKLNYWFLNWAVPIFCQRATAIVTVSHATKRDVVAHYHIDPAKVHVIHEAASPHFAPPRPAVIAQTRYQYQLPDRYLLHLGTLEPRKNIGRLLDALTVLRHDQPDLHLVLVGSKGWLYDDLLQRIASEPYRDHVHLLGWVEDSALPAIIAAAQLGVYPTLYEGFGLPLLEMMACGQVVAASRTASLPEIGHDAAVYFDPTDVAEMARVIGRLLHDRDEYDHRRQLGLARAQQFSWQKTALATETLYDQLLA